MFSKSIFLFLFVSTLLLGKEPPVLYDSLSKPLFHLNELFSDIYFTKNYTTDVNEYQKNVDALKKQAEILSTRTVTHNDKKRYLFELRKLQKQYDALFMKIAKEFNHSMQEKNSEEFLSILKHTKGLVLDDKYLYTKSVKYYKEEGLVGLSPLLQQRIKEDKSYIKMYNSNISIMQRVPTKAYVEKRYGNFIDKGMYIKDIRTGLLWQKNGTSSGKKNFYEAKKYAKELKLDGLGGWRVPTADELASVFPATQVPFENTPYRPDQCCEGEGEWNSYWTSQRDFRLDDYAFVYHWYGKGGRNNCYASKNYSYVRCVRGNFRKRD